MDFPEFLTVLHILSQKKKAFGLAVLRKRNPKQDVVLQPEEVDPNSGNMVAQGDMLPCCSEQLLHLTEGEPWSQLAEPPEEQLSQTKHFLSTILKSHLNLGGCDPRVRKYLSKE